MDHAEQARIAQAVAGLDAWFDTMRSDQGYAGPVAHWWQQSFIHTGAGLDWRYQGIIGGYINLWRATRNEFWLAKARRAGDDLLRGQLANGHFAASAFEINPATAGTPHEACCDSALLTLSQALREAGNSDYQPYAQAALKNLQSFYLAQLWDPQTRSFRDHPRIAGAVPNKAASVCEALFLAAETQQDEEWIERFALPTLDDLLSYQIRTAGRFNGAIRQNRIGTQFVEKYFPIYIARCIPALLRGYQWSLKSVYLEAALAAMQFIVTWMDADGWFPTVIYPNGAINQSPVWIAAVADILYAADLLRPYGWQTELSATRSWLLAGADRSGAIQTARGFAGQAGGLPPRLPDLRDVLHVAGWCDKPFRYLTTLLRTPLPAAQSEPFQSWCVWRGQRMLLTETPAILEITTERQVQYRWRKGAQWPEVAAPAFWLR